MQTVSQGWQRPNGITLERLFYSFCQRVYAMLYLFTDEGARQSNNGPEENATAQDDLSVEAVAQVTEDGSCHHEAADEDCERKREKTENGFY